MKVKKLDKKLDLNKITVADLSRIQMERIIGGEFACTDNCTQDCYETWELECRRPDLTEPPPGTTTDH